MNAISLYVSTSRIILHYDHNSNDHKIADLYRLVPYLRQSLSCAVCGRLLKDPYSPIESKCQHNVCRLCVRGRKNIRPACNSCKDCQDFRAYEENKQMRILLQCYKSMCEHIMSTALYSVICTHSLHTINVSSGVNIPSLSLVELIEEGANFEDILMAFTAELPKSYTNISPPVVTSVPVPSTPSPVIPGITPQLPLIIKQEFPLIDMPLPIPTQPNSTAMSFLNNSSSIISTTSIVSPTVVGSSIKQTQIKKSQNFVHQPRNILPAAPIETKSIMMAPLGSTTAQIRNPPPIKTVSNGTAMYSVLYTGIGNKITIKRKTDVDEENTSKKTVAPTLFRQVTKQNIKRRGCRCGNATATPGKLTCCGQRCPCYVDSKSCIGCKCRGCRNPHRPDGGKVRPIIPELACYEIHMADDSTNMNAADLPITKDPVATANNHLTATSFNRKEFPLNDFPVTSRITVTPVLSNTSSIAHRNPTIHPPQQHSLKQSQTFTASNKVQRDQGVVQLENLSKESLLIQSPEGKYQVVNVFTSTSHQSQQSIQRIHSISHNNSSNTFIVPNSNSQISTTTIHQIPEISTTLPQIIMQQQSQQQLQPNNKPSISSNTQSSTFSKHNNVITVHTVPPHSVSQSKNSKISISTTPATFTLSPIIVTSPSSFTSELFHDDDYLTSSHASTGDSPLTISHPSLLEVVETSEM